MSSSGSIEDFEIILTAEPVDGRPLTMRFAADLVGGADYSKELYCTGTTWKFGDGTISADTPWCHEWTMDVQVNRHLEQTYVYDKAGTYAVTLRWGPLPPVTIVAEVIAEPTTP